MTPNHTLIDDVTNWLALPYSNHQQSMQHGFNCWGLMRAFLLAHGFKDVQGVAVDFNDKTAVEHEAHAQLSRGVWQAIDTPEPYCIVQMTHATTPHHVGVWVPVNGGMVLHTTEGTGSILQKRHLVKQLGFHITCYYRFIG